MGQAEPNESVSGQFSAITNSPSDANNLTEKALPNNKIPDHGAALTRDNREAIATLLGWVSSTQASNLCVGYYEAPNLNHSQADLPDNGATRIGADTAQLNPEGRSILKGNVTIEQLDTFIAADLAYLYRDESGEVTEVDLYGNVEFRQPGKLLLGKQASLNLKEKTGTIENAIYRMTREGGQYPDESIEMSCEEGIVGWGRAYQILQQDADHFELINASYATCPPTRNSWMIKASSIRLDTQKNMGTARNARLEWGGVPFLYFPYYTFPITDARKSGVLPPIIGYSDRHGIQLGVPIYLNLASNYDAILTPAIYTERGFFLGGEGRYLTRRSVGQVDFTVIPDDRRYAKFKRDNPNEFTGRSTNARGSIGVDSTTQFTPFWRAGINYNNVSDDFYLQDFGPDLEATTRNHLLQQGEVEYRGSNWTFLGRAQGYRTLRPFNQAPVSDVYSRLPQLVLTGTYPNQFAGANYQLLSSYDNFAIASTARRPEGSRFHINPIASLPIESIAGYVTPTAQLQQTNYLLHGDLQGFSKKPTRTIPMFQIDSGLFYERDLSIARKGHIQTLEPRLFYAYIPFVNQQQIPNFDSRYYIFTYEQLFRPNRFSGIDRIGDTNQISYALSSRLLDAETGEERLQAGIGQIFYFEKRRVLLEQFFSENQIPILPVEDVFSMTEPLAIGFLNPNDRVSPIAGFVNYHFNPNLNMVADLAWDPNIGQANNSNVNIFYQPGDDSIFNLGYAFLVNGDSILARDDIQDQNLSQVILSYAFPLTQQVRTLGTWTHNISKGFPMQYYFGLEYETCCWAARLVGGRVFTNLNENQNRQFKNAVYFQLLLKGAGGFNFNAPDTLTSAIPGFRDIF